MAIGLDRQKKAVAEGLLQLYRIGSLGSSVSSLQVDVLQDYIQTTVTEYNKARVAWERLVTLEGATRARELIVEEISGAPSDIPALFASVRTSVLGLLNAYENNLGAGTPNKTFDYTEEVDGSLSGGFSNINVDSGLIPALNTLCTAIRDACEPLVITE